MFRDTYSWHFSVAQCGFVSTGSLLKLAGEEESRLVGGELMGKRWSGLWDDGFVSYFDAAGRCLHV